MENEIQHIQAQNLEEVKTEFRKIYYSSLLQQKQENETNRIKIAAISIGITIAGIVGIIGKGIESFSDLLLPIFDIHCKLYPMVEFNIRCLPQVGNRRQCD